MHPSSGQVNGTMSSSSSSSHWVVGSGREGLGSTGDSGTGLTAVKVPTSTFGLPNGNTMVRFVAPCGVPNHASIARVYNFPGPML